jgi:hypothetical protein
VVVAGAAVAFVKGISECDDRLSYIPYFDYPPLVLSSWYYAMAA